MRRQAIRSRAEGRLPSLWLQIPPNQSNPQSMDDLTKLNRRIAKHWLGSLDSDQEVYLSYASVCLGLFIPDAAKLAQFLARSKQTHHNSLPVAKLNRQYLRFARLAAKDVTAGKVEMLVRLGVKLDQSELLSNLTNDELNRLAFGWDDGPIIEFDSQAFIRGAALHVRAAPYHATAYVATCLVT